jgi:hypothetical protein
VLSSLTTGSRQTHWHGLDARDQVRLQSLDSPGKLDVLQLAQQGLKRQAEFESHEMCADAEMWAFAERYMLVGTTPQVEPVGICKDCLIAIG